MDEGKGAYENALKRTYPFDFRKGYVQKVKKCGPGRSHLQDIYAASGASG